MRVKCVYVYGDVKVFNLQYEEWTELCKWIISSTLKYFLVQTLKFLH